MFWQTSILIIYLVPRVLSDCAEYPIQNEVNLKELSGMWYLHYKSAGAQELHSDYKCMRNYYSVNSDGKTADYMVALLPLSNVQSWEGKSFYSTVTKNTTDGVLYVKIIDPRVGDLDLPYYILSTDYTTHLITYVCKGMSGIWVMSRERTAMDDNSISKVKEALKQAKLTLESFKVILQDNCP